MIINSKEKLEKLYENIEIPEVDFQKKTLIALMMGTIYDGGHTIGVDSIYEYDSYIEIKINSNLAQTGYSVTHNIEAPVIIVSIAKTDKPIIFKEIANTTKLCH